MRTLKDVVEDIRQEQERRFRSKSHREKLSQTAAYEILILAQTQAEWSQATFGSDKVRGPLGALRHLEKEAREAAAEAEAEILATGSGEMPTCRSGLRDELADCFLLILDASRRAGLTPLQLIQAAREKMRINRSREWPEPVADEPVEHIKG